MRFSIKYVVVRTGKKSQKMFYFYTSYFQADDVKLFGDNTDTVVGLEIAVRSYIATLWRWNK